jgi:hypothetical protein
MRQRADRHEVGAGRRELRDALERHAAGDLDLRAAAGTDGRPARMSAVAMLSTRIVSRRPCPSA